VLIALHFSFAQNYCQSLIPLGKKAQTFRIIATFQHFSSILYCLMQYWDWALEQISLVLAKSANGC